jgi:putative membrane protein
MKFIGRFVIHTLSNAIALVIAANLITGFYFNGDITALIVAAIALAVINAFVRPIMKLLLGPFLVLSFGLLTIFINAVCLFLVPYLLAFFGMGSPIGFDGYLPLLLATVIISAVNLILGLSAKWGYKN